MKEPQNPIEISVVVPCFNEHKNAITNGISEMLASLEKVNRSYEVLLIDDGSTDDSMEVLKRKFANDKTIRLVKAVHSGKCGALYNGIKLAKGEWVLLTDFDQSTPMTELIKLLPHMNSSDLIIGSRGADRDASDLVRKAASRIFNAIRRFFVLQKIDDTQCGFKLIKRELALKLFPKLSVLQTQYVKAGWHVSAFDIELLYRAEKNGVNIIEQPVAWSNTDISTTKDRKFVAVSLDMVRQILNILTLKDV